MTATTSDRLPTLKVGDLEEGKRYTAYAPNGQQIVGTVEMVPAYAGVSCFTKASVTSTARLPRFAEHRGRGLCTGTRFRRQSENENCG